LKVDIKSVRVQIGRRYRQVRALKRSEGLTGIVTRFRKIASETLAPKHAMIPVRAADVISADLSRPPRRRVPKIVAGSKIVANWIIIPPGPRAGGHTTTFRVIRYLEANGYRNRVYFYNVYSADEFYYKSILRDHYDFHGEVASTDEGMKDAHAVIATSWQTAYPSFNSHCAGKRFYFVQDFEPYFYPVGSLSVLAENTYRMGFHGISMGSCFANKLSTQFGMAVDSVEYGCDTSRYSLLSGTKRSGVVFYARRDAPRRGFELGVLTMQLFAARHPDIDIHVYGAKLGKLPFRCIDHGRITPEKLNQLYNICYAGLTLSFTNVSLVALEMLAAGCIPIVNDSAEVRTDLHSPFVHYALPYPSSLVSALESVITMHDFKGVSQAAAKSVRAATWDQSGAAVDQVLRRVIRAHSDSPPNIASEYQSSVAGSIIEKQ
jgi:glycosyltransferase involved in cell wall biosynthesis